MTEVAESEPNDSFYQSASFRAGIVTQLEDESNRRHQLEIKMIQLEEDAQNHQQELDDKDFIIKKL